MAKPKKSAFTYMPGDRVNVPGLKGVQGLVSFPASKSDGECGAINTLAKPVKASRIPAKAKLPPAPAPEENEGRVIFVAWIGEEGTRERGYFTEASLRDANMNQFALDLIPMIHAATKGMGWRRVDAKAS